MPFSIIAAIARNNVIGKDNKLPWDIPDDLENFYKLVNGKTIIMGRKTYESLKGPIENSENIVLSHSHSLRLSGCLVMHSIAEVLTKYKNSFEEIMVIGGAPVYEAFLPHANKMYLTLIDSDIEGDVYFPEWRKEEWEIITKREARSGKYSYSFMVLERKSF